MSPVKQVSEAFREYFTGYLNTVGLEFDNIVAQTNAAFRGIGTWTTVPFVSGNFVGGGAQTWTVGPSQVTTFEYATYGGTGVGGGGAMDIHIHIVGTTVGGTANAALKILVPNNAVVLSTCSGAYSYKDNGTFGTGIWEALAAGSSISFYKVDKSNWGGSTAATDIRATLTLSTQ